MPRQIVDGFTMSPVLRMNPYDSNALTLGQLDNLRRAKGYKPRWYAMPDLSDPAIQPTDTFQRQVQLKPGTYIWGLTPVLMYNFNGGNGENYNGQSLPFGTVHFFVRDDATGIPLFDDFVGDWMFATCNRAIQVPGQYYTGFVTGDINTNRYPILLTQPRLVAEPGLVTIMITNTSPYNFGGGAAVRCQIVLNCAEPCDPQTDAGVYDPCNQ